LKATALSAAERNFLIDRKRMSLSKKPRSVILMFITY
jgi:hypothetical protein